MRNPTAFSPPSEQTISPDILLEAVGMWRRLYLTPAPTGKGALSVTSNTTSDPTSQSNSEEEELKAEVEHVKVTLSPGKTMASVGSSWSFLFP